MMLIRIGLIGVLLFCISTSIAQQDSLGEYDSYQEELRESFRTENLAYRLFNRYEINPGFSQYSVGPAYTMPVSNWDYFDYTFAARYHQGHTELGAAFWKGQRNGEVDTANAYRLSAGYFTPLRFFKIGKRTLDVRGALLQPAMAVGYTYTAGNHGLYIAPEMHFQFPFGLVAARANVEYTFGNGGGFNILPEVSIRLDALRTLLNPKVVKTGVNTYSSSTAAPLGGGWYKVTTNTTQSDFTLKDVGPFWGVTPRFGRAMNTWTDVPYNSMGLGIAGRINFMGADIHVDKGAVAVGINKNVNDIDETVKNNFDNSKIAGITNVTTITFEGNVNVPFLILGIIKKEVIRDMGWRTTPLNRFNFHLGMTYFSVGKMQLTDAVEATAYTNQFFTDNPNVERNEINDPLQAKSGWGPTYGFSYEMGAVGLRVNNKTSLSAGRSTIAELYFILPITKIVRAYSK